LNGSSPPHSRLNLFGVPTSALAEQWKVQKKAWQMPGFVYLLSDRLYCFRSQTDRAGVD